MRDIYDQRDDLRNEITRLRQSLHEARELIERMAVYAPYAEEDAARKWLEERRDDTTGR